MIDENKFVSLHSLVESISASKKRKNFALNDIAELLKSEEECTKSESIILRRFV